MYYLLVGITPKIITYDGGERYATKEEIDRVLSYGDLFCKSTNK